jgi:hypothetical protein
MLHDLSIRNFRSLQSFTMAHLARVNLIVGANNCGKTTVLEAVHLLAEQEPLLPVWSILTRRGEMLWDGEREGDVSHLTYGHKIEVGSGFSVSAHDNAVVREVRFGFEVRTGERGASQPGVPFEEPDPDIREGPALDLVARWRDGSGEHASYVPLSARGGLSVRTLERSKVRGDAAPVHLITTEGLSRERVVALFEEIVLTPEEATVLEALRTIEPAIDRIASVGASRTMGGRGGIVMSWKGQRLPIGSMGDGIWRILGITLALLRAKGGILLVDEIDTGLHYSVLTSLWQIVLHTAARLNVQVFATTHSRDCYEALAEVTVNGRHEISLQRMERGRGRAVAFTEAELRAAAARGIEVR